MKGYFAKSALAVLMLFAVAVSAMAQDKIVTNDGDVITAYEVEVASSAVYYKKAKSDMSVQRISKSDVMVIKFADGRKQVFDDSGSEGAAAQQPAANVEEPAFDSEENKRLIDSFNDYSLEYLLDDTDKSANAMLMAYAVSDDSQLCNSEIEIIIEKNLVPDAKGWLFIGGHAPFNVKVRNKLNTPIFIDLASCVLNNNEVRNETFYDNTTIVNQHTGSTGAGVNLGSVASAVGLGGALGKLAGGVSVGGGNANTTTVVKQNERYLPVPPCSTVSLPKKYLTGYYTTNAKGKEEWVCVPFHKSLRPKGAYYDYLLINTDKSFARGTKYTYTSENSPVNTTLMISYTKGDAQQLSNLFAKFYVREIMGLRIHRNMMDSGRVISGKIIMAEDFKDSEKLNMGIIICTEQTKVTPVFR